MAISHLEYIKNLGESLCRKEQDLGSLLDACELQALRQHCIKNGYTIPVNSVITFIIIVIIIIIITQHPVLYISCKKVHA